MQPDWTGFRTFFCFRHIYSLGLLVLEVFEALTHPPQSPHPTSEGTWTPVWGIDVSRTPIPRCLETFSYLRALPYPPVHLRLPIPWAPGGGRGGLRRPHGVLCTAAAGAGGAVERGRSRAQTLGDRFGV